MVYIKKSKIFKIILAFIVFVIIVGTIIYLFPIMKDLSTVEGQIAFKEKVDNSSVWGILALFALQVGQMFLVVLPGEPLEVLAGMCYGVIGGTIFIFASVFIITTIVFWLSRKFGKKFVYSFFSKEKVDKIENSKFFKKQKLVEYIMLILFLIPGTPKDLLTYIGGLLPVKPLNFILIATFGRFPSVISSTIVGANLSSGDWKISVMVYGITLTLTLLFIFLMNKFDKHKLTKKVMKDIK